MKKLQLNSKKPSKKQEEKERQLLERLSKIIDYKFNDPALFLIALTHKSKSASNNERLEFLGDAVLSLISANFLFQQKGQLREGKLSSLRAMFVCQKHLSESALKHDLGELVISDSSMKRSGSNSSPSVLCDVVEAIIGAVFLDGGLKKAEQVIFKLLGEPFLELPVMDKDAKTELQELVQSKKLPTPQYELLERHGPAHAPIFVMGVKIQGQVVAIGSGESKKIATQGAALKAMEALGS